MSAGIGDPASTSALGGALRAMSLRLADLVEQLGEPVSGSRRPAVAETALERELVTAAAEQLDRIGATLQGLVTSGIERESRRRGLGEVAARNDLDIDGPRVKERWGPSRTDPTRRLAAQEHLQDLLNRVAAAHGRDLATLARELEASRVALRAVTVRARASSG